MYPVDSFSIGQLASKAWLLHHLHRVGPKDKDHTIGLFGCWIGALVPFLHNDWQVERVYGFDLDNYTIELAERVHDNFNGELEKILNEYNGTISTCKQGADMEATKAGFRSYLEYGGDNEGKSSIIACLLGNYVMHYLSDTGT